MGVVNRYPLASKAKSYCRTPGAVYTTAFRPSTIALYIDLPLPMVDFPARFPQEQELVQYLHEALLPAIERFYRENWHKLAGKNVDGEPMPSAWEQLSATPDHPQPNQDHGGAL